MPVGTLLGFDYGLKRIGVAVGQTVTGTANPLCILSARDGQPDWGKVAEIITEWRPAALVVGLPRHADGSDSPITAGARRFAGRLQGRFGKTVYLLDERLSSRAAAEVQSDGKRGQPLDDLAAACILQDWLLEPQAAQALGETTEE